MIIENEFDPFDQFTNYTNSELNNTLGFLPGWVVNPEYFEFNLIEALNKQYNFGLFESKETIITEDGIYKYPGDPDLYPIIKIVRGKETFYQYLYGLIGIIKEDGTSYAARMD